MNNTLTKQKAERPPADNSAHTPGPWHILNTKPPPKVGQKDKPGFVALLGIPGEGHRNANARLIAAAPDLLNALKNLTGKIVEMNGCLPANYDGGEETYPEWIQAEDAIARAEGSAQ